MNLETEITDEMRNDLIAVLLRYRREPQVPMPERFEMALRHERKISGQCLERILQILQRGQKPVLDCDVIDRFERVRERLFPKTR